MHRDGVELVPALEATVGFDDGFKQIGHFSSFFLCPRSESDSPSAFHPSVPNMVTLPWVGDTS
jgi:hypothetical protein